MYMRRSYYALKKIVNIQQKSSFRYVSYTLLFCVINCLNISLFTQLLTSVLPSYPHGYALSFSLPLMCLDVDLLSETVYLWQHWLKR